MRRGRTDEHRLDYLLAERDKGEKRHLEMLHTERYTYDRKTQEYSEGKVQHCYFHTSHKNPDNVHDDGKTASVIGIRLNVTAERPERKACQLYELKAERDTDYRDAEQKSDDKVVKADEEAAEHKPKDVS